MKCPLYCFGGRVKAGFRVGLCFLVPGDATVRQMNDKPLFLLLVLALVAYCCNRPVEAKPNDLEARIRNVIGRTPPSSWDQESEAQRAVRLDLAAHAVRLGSQGDEQLAAALIALGQHESGFAQYVGEGCDPVPKGAANCDGGRARSYWQAWRVACPRAWELPRGSREATIAFAVCAGKKLQGQAKRCQGQHPAGYWAGAFSGYRSTPCDWKPAAERARTMQVKLQLLQSRDQR